MHINEGEFPGEFYMSVANLILLNIKSYNHILYIYNNIII